MPDASGRPRLRLALRELAALRREKTILLAILIQLFVAGFSSFLVVGLVSLYDPGAATGATGAQVTLAVAGNATESVAPVVEGAPGLSAVTFENRSAAMAAFRQGRAGVDGVFHVTAAPSGLLRVDAVAPGDDFRTTLVVSRMKDVLGALEQQRRAALSHRLAAQPLGLPARVDANPFYGFAYTLLVPLLVFLPVFIAGSITADSMAEEFERGTDELLLVAPLSRAAILEGKALAAVGLVPVQVAAWLALLSINGLSVASPLLLIVLATGLATLVVLAGGLLAVAVRERRSAQLLYSVGALVAAAVSAVPAESPVNAVAKLAVGSATPATYAVVAVTVLLAVEAVPITRVLATLLTD